MLKEPLKVSSKKKKEKKKEVVLEKGLTSSTFQKKKVYFLKNNVSLKSVNSQTPERRPIKNLS